MIHSISFQLSLPPPSAFQTAKNHDEGVFHANMVYFDVMYRPEAHEGHHDTDLTLNGADFVILSRGRRHTQSHGFICGKQAYIK